MTGLRPYLVGAALGVGLVSGAWLGQERWEGMLTAQPAQATLSNEKRSLGLTGFARCLVAVEDLPDALKGDVSKATVKKWVTNRLENVGVRVVTEEQRSKALMAADRSHDAAWLRAADEVGSAVYVNVGALRHPDGTVLMNVDLEVMRGVFLWPGHYGVRTVWNTGRLQYFGRADDPEQELRETLDELMDIFEKDWKTCNR